MTVSPPHRPDPWRLAWRVAAGNPPLAACLFVLALYWLLLAWIPQFSPDLATADRWLAQARFGPWTGVMYRMGLFSLTHSPVVPVLLSLLAFLLILRSAELAEAFLHPWRERLNPGRWRAQAFPFLACLGVLILLAGVLIGHRWGWREDGLIGPASAPLPDREGETPRRYRVGFGPALTVRATDAADRPLKLQQTARQAAQTELILYLTPAAPESAFAIAESRLVVRLGAQGDLSAQSPIRVEIFRAPSGERVQETTIESDALRLSIDEVRLEIVRQPYPLMAAVYDPGLWLKRAGLVLGAIGLTGTLARRWQKERILVPVLFGLTLLVATMAAYSLETRGALGGLSFQLEASALWIVGLGGWLIRASKESG